MHVVIVGALGIARLDLDRLLEGLGRQELLDRGRALLERPLGVIGHLGGDRLPALAPLAEHLHGGVDVLLADLLEVVEILDHWHGPECGVRERRTAGELRDTPEIYALHNGSQGSLLRRNINLYAKSGRLILP